MSDFLQNAESRRFLDVVDELIRQKVVNNVATFCRQVDFDPKSFSHIKTGKRNVPIELIGKLYTIFGGNPIFIVSGQGSLLIDDNETAQQLQEARVQYGNSDKLAAENERLNKLLNLLIKHAEDNRDYIKFLKEQIKKLEAGEPTAKGSKV